MPVVLKLDTKPTLFEPIEVEIDGRLYKVKEITLGGLEQIQNLQAELTAGSAAAIRKALSALLEGDLEPFKDLQLAKIRKLIETLIERVLTASDEEKNGPGPGGAS